MQGATKPVAGQASDTMGGMAMRRPKNVQANHCKQWVEHLFLCLHNTAFRKYAFPTWKIPLNTILSNTGPREMCHYNCFFFIFQRDW